MKTSWKAQDSHRCFPLNFHQSHWVHKYITEYCIHTQNKSLSPYSSPFQLSFLISQTLADLGLTVWRTVDVHLSLTAVTSGTLLSVSRWDTAVLFKIVKHWDLKEISAFSSRGKWHFLGAWFRSPVLCHWDTSTGDCWSPAAAPKWCESCVCHLEMVIWSTTRRLTYHRCPLLGSWIKTLELLRWVNCTPGVQTSKHKSCLASLWDAMIWFCTKQSLSSLDYM